MYQILLKTAQEVKRTDVNLFRNTKTRHHFNQKILYEFG